MVVSRLTSGAPQNAFPDALRAYDQAIIDLMREIVYRDEPADVKMGTESRIFSQIFERRESAVAGETRQTFTLPIMVLTPMGAVPDPSRWTASPVRRLAGGPADTENTIYLDPKTKDEILHLPFPLPMNFMYQIDILTKTGQQMNDFRTQVLSWWCSHPRETFINVDIPYYGTKAIPLILQRDDDTSEIESGEEERELRHTLTLNLEGWIFKYPAIRVLENGRVVLKPKGIKTIKNINIAMIDGDANDESLRDWYCDSSHYTYDEAQLVSIEESPEHTPPERVLSIFTFSGD